MRKQWKKTYGKVAYVTALSLILGSGAYFGIGAADDTATVVASAEDAATTITPGSLIVKDNFADYGVAEVTSSAALAEKQTRAFPLFEGYTTQIKFDNKSLASPFVNWNNFVVTTDVANDKQVVLRVDNWVERPADKDDKQFDKGKVETDNLTITKATTLDFDKLEATATGEVVVSVNQISATVVEVKYTFHDGKTQTYTITYKSSIKVKDYNIYLGNYNSEITLKEVKFVKNPSSGGSSSGGSSSTTSAAPTASQSPAASQTPAASGSPAASQTPAASGSPAASGAPAASEAPAASDAPAVSEAPSESQTPAESQTPVESQTPSDGDDDDNNNTNTSKEPEKQTNATAKKQNGITVKADTKANGTATISTVKKTNKATVTIASTITVNGVKYKVTTIGANAFKNCKKATKVSLPSTVTTINKNAFAGAKKLKTIKLTGKKAVTVKKGAFKGLNTKKMTVTVSKKMTKKQFNKMKKNLKNAGFKGKVKKA